MQLDGTREPTDVKILHILRSLPNVFLDYGWLFECPILTQPSSKPPKQNTSERDLSENLKDKYRTVKFLISCIIIRIDELNVRATTEQLFFIFSVDFVSTEYCPSERIVQFALPSRDVGAV